MYSTVFKLYSVLSRFNIRYPYTESLIRKAGTSDNFGWCERDIGWLERATLTWLGPGNDGKHIIKRSEPLIIIDTE